MTKKALSSFISILCVSASALLIRSADSRDIAIPVMGTDGNFSCPSVTLCDLADSLFEKYVTRK